MSFLLAAMLCGAVFGNIFLKIGFGSLNMFSLFILAASITYLTVFLYSRSGKVKYQVARPADKYLWMFFGVGVVAVIFSYIGVYSTFFPNNQLLRDTTYIPRQAYYIFFIPIIILAGRNASSPKLLDFISANRVFIFFGVWIAYVLLNQTIALNVPCAFALSTLMLMTSGERKAIDLPMLLILLFSPIAVGGEMTQAIIRLVALSTYIVRFNSTILKYSIAGLIMIILACYLLPFMPLEEFGFDANTAWRAKYWGNELVQLGKTYGLGVGYGTSYASLEFVGAALTGPFAATEEYSVAEKLFVVGCHNSFVSLFFRLGVIGIFSLFAYLGSLACHVIEIKGGYASSAAFALISSLAIVCFNVGFENPSYFFIFGFSLALVSSQMTPGG